MRPPCAIRPVLPWERSSFFATSPRKLSEEALRESAHRKDEFLALLAHELRNPLAPLRNGLEVMRLAAGDAAAVAHAQHDGATARPHGPADR